MALNLQKLQKIALFLLTFLLIALWNIPHTIAGRYACEALLFIIVISLKPSWTFLLRANKYLAAFSIYILLHWLFFSSNHRIAFDNFRAEWMHFILFSIIGGGLGFTIGNRYNIRFILAYLGVAFSVPLLIHLILFAIKSYQLKAFHTGFVGISETHGPLAYAALQAVILFFTYLIYQARNNLEKIIAIFFIAICFSSPIVASSRGGIGFVILSMIFICTHHFLCNQTVNNSSNRRFLSLAIILTISVVTIMGAAKLDPQRWQGGLSRIVNGLNENPIDVFCIGKSLTPSNLEKNSVDLSKKNSVGIELAFDGDISRALVGKAGLILAAKNPMGFDGSKNGYQLAIFKECGRTPALTISNAHNGWIDTSLAIGMPGAFLLFLVFLRYAQIGWSTSKADSNLAPIAIALFASSSIWILRGLVDSTLRDQMLEMQAFTFAFLLGVLLRVNQINTKG